MVTKTIQMEYIYFCELSRGLRLSGSFKGQKYSHVNETKNWIFMLCWGFSISVKELKTSQFYCYPDFLISKQGHIGPNSSHYMFVIWLQKNPFMAIFALQA